MLLIIFLLCLIFASKCTISCFFFFNDTATTEIYTLSLHDALPISGVFESTTDVVFSGHLIISENGKILCENNRFQRENEVITSIIDIDKLNNMRIKNLSFRESKRTCPFTPFEIDFKFKNTSIDVFDRSIHKHPFVPANEHEREIRSKEIFNIQSAGLAKRLSHTKLEKVIVGISEIGR